MQKGFSLIEIMVASVALSVVGLGVSTMISQQSKQVNYLEDRMSHQNFKRQIEDVLYDQASCLNSIQGVRLPAGLISSNQGTDIDIKDAAGQLVYNNTNMASFEGLQIKSIKLRNLDISVASPNGKALIDIQVERKRSIGQAQLMKSIQIEKTISVDPSLQVTGCAGDSGSNNISCLTSYAPTGVYGFNTTRCGGGFFSASCHVVNYPHRIPADAKLIKIYKPSYTYDRNNIGVTGSGNTTDSDYVTVPATDISIPLNGLAKTTDGTVIQPGGTINRVVSRYGQGTITYNGRVILTETRTSGGQGQSVTTGYQSALRSTASVSVCDEEGLMNRYDLTYYK